MTTLPKTLAAIALLFTATTASADTYHHIDQLALSIERQAKRLVSESRHYRHTPQYRELRDDSRDLARLADHLHDVAHDHGSLAHMESDLFELDAKFHHLESLFDCVERAASYGHGHVHGNTSHVRRLLNSIENDIHHLQEDLRTLRTPICVQPIVKRQTYRPPYNSGFGYNSRSYSTRTHSSHYGHPGIGNQRVYPTRSRGITIGGGSSQFTFRF
ncbi:MAG: hypothetical protein AB8B91_05360 [Rubripirellula sp.]